MKTLTKKIMSITLLFLLTIGFMVPSNAFAMSAGSDFDFERDFEITSVRADNDTIKIYYTLKKDLNCDSRYSTWITLSADWTGNMKIASQRCTTTNLKITDTETIKKGKRKGSYSVTLSKPKYVGVIDVKAKYNLDLRTHRIGRVKYKRGIFSAPYGTKKFGHVVTKAEAIGDRTIKFIAPGIAFMIAPELKFVKGSAKILKTVTIAASVYGGWSCLDQVLSACAIDYRSPDLVAGQYYQIKSWYDHRAKTQKSRITIWLSEDAFNKNETPAYDKTFTVGRYE